MIPARLFAAGFVCPPAVPEALAPMKAEPGKLSGTWCRDAGPVHVSVKFKEGRLTATGFYDAGEDSVKVTIDADYAAGPDGAVFGQITGLDAGPGCLAAPLQTFTGQPFAFRTRIEDDVISVADVKFAGVGVKMPGEPAYAGIRIPPMSKDVSVSTAVQPAQGLELGAILNLVGGRYKPDDGTWKPTGKTPPKQNLTLSFGPAPVLTLSPPPAVIPGTPVTVPAAVPTPTLVPTTFVPTTVPLLPSAGTMPTLPKKDAPKSVPPAPKTASDMLTNPIPLKK